MVRVRDMVATAQPEAQLLTVEELAQRLRIGRGLAWALVRRGEIASIRIGQRRVLVPASAVSDFIAERLAEGTAR